MIYNIVINSVNYVGGTNSSNLSYYFDWSNIEDGEYEMTFNFNAIDTAVHKVLYVVIPDLGVASNVFTTTSQTTARFNNVIGVISPNEKTTDTHYIASTVDNPPIYLRTRPQSNNFTVYFYDTDGALSNLNVDYILILSLKKL